MGSCPPGESRRGAGPLLASVGDLGSRGQLRRPPARRGGSGERRGSCPDRTQSALGLGLALGKTLSVAAVRLAEAPSGHDKPGKHRARRAGRPRTGWRVADRLIVRGAREHNLKDVSLDLPRDALIVFTGLSGSGKSSLAFDTIFAEGQRRYVESLSAYARQFLGQMDKPDVDFIEGLSPAVSIDQKSTSRNPRSTVGTITEVYDYLRLLYARIGHPHCPVCGDPIARQTPQQIVDQVLALDQGTRFQVLAPVARGRKGEYLDLFRQLQAQGYARVRVNGEVHALGEVPKLNKQKKHTIEVVVDRLAVKASSQATLDRFDRDRPRASWGSGRARLR